MQQQIENFKDEDVIKIPRQLLRFIEWKISLVENRLRKLAGEETKPDELNFAEEEAH